MASEDTGFDILTALAWVAGGLTVAGVAYVSKEYGEANGFIRGEVSASKTFEEKFQLQAQEFLREKEEMKIAGDALARKTRALIVEMRRRGIEIPKEIFDSVGEEVDVAKRQDKLVAQCRNAGLTKEYFDELDGVVRRCLEIKNLDFDPDYSPESLVADKRRLKDVIDDLDELSLEVDLLARSGICMVALPSLNKEQITRLSVKKFEDVMVMRNICNECYVALEYISALVGEAGSLVGEDWIITHCQRNDGKIVFDFVGVKNRINEIRDNLYMGVSVTGERLTKCQKSVFQKRLRSYGSSLREAELDWGGLGES